MNNFLKNLLTFYSWATGYATYLTVTIAIDGKAQPRDLLIGGTVALGSLVVAKVLVG